ncbi:uncharacterized protein J4E92_006743 [Alternaria infectoria]|uniref:uncharacterized protein n=1 Tax=Alternaria infectoria TaxID=45303 RepID=UPI0022211336|nr:uncharacterized protein J4E92_006743 [Alternaria infectoria]KAI4926006.1 hypothetical protein J4E92_006743 [Alternaria infectoria]
MPSFQRLKHPFRRPTHYYTIHEPSPTPRQLETQREKERQRALDKIENDLDDGRIGPRSSDSPDELPVIIDRGPYRGHIYPREQLFFNSIMLASDVEPIYAGPPGGELRQEVHRTPLRRPKTQAEQKLPPRPVPSEYLTASQNRENLRRWEEKNNKSAAAGQTQHPRPVPSEYLTSAQNTENLRRWEERSGRTPTVRRTQIPERRPSPPGQPSPPRAPITPGTSEWDGFMDFPSGNHQSGDPGVQATVNESNASHSLPTTTTPTLALHYDVVQDSAPPHLPPFPALVPPSNAASDIPIVVRLVQRLHAAVYGLQDRVWGLEEDLISQLSTQLEENHLQIRELDRENSSLQDEITELKRIADFSTKVLTGCWEREWEVWRTLLDIQRRREMYRSPLACIFSRNPTPSVQDDGLLDFCKPEGYVAPPLPTGKVTQAPLKKKELDALLLMAKQNVTIPIEDLGELKGLAEAYDRRNGAEEERPVEGSRRDV